MLARREADLVEIPSASCEPFFDHGLADAFGVVGGTDEIFRPNALTGDPNHLGIELVLPLLVLTPLYLRLERAHPWRVPLAALLVFLLLVELATLSRSGLLGLACGTLVLLLPYRHHLTRARFLVPFGAALAIVAAIVLARLEFFLKILEVRTNVSRASIVGPPSCRIRWPKTRAASTNTGSLRVTSAWRGVLVRGRWTTHSPRAGASNVVSIG